MITTVKHQEQKTSAVDGYWNMVKHLSPEAKIDLITLLTQSLKTTKREKMPASKYYGIWGDDGLTDEEFTSELKSLRSFNNDMICVTDNIKDFHRFDGIHLDNWVKRT